MIEILPGEITDPHWGFARCGICARPVGGDGSMWKTCDDVPQAHLSMESVPRAKRDKFFADKAWDNALRMAGLLDAIDWMTAPRGELNPAGQPVRPIDALRAGNGMAVLELQFVEWPQLEREHNALRRHAA